MNSMLTDLAAATSIADGDLTYGAFGGNSRKVAWSTVRDYVNATGVQGATGLTDRGVYSSITAYGLGDFVRASDGGIYYVTNPAGVTGVDPTTDSTNTYWTYLFPIGFDDSFRCSTWEETTPVTATTSGGTALTSGKLIGAFFRATKSGAWTKVAVSTGSASATPTLMRCGVYSVAADWSLSALLASSANDTTRMNSAFQSAYDVSGGAKGTNNHFSLSSTFTSVRAAWYFVGFLYVGTTAPQIHGTTLDGGTDVSSLAVGGRAPLAAMYDNGSTIADLPASVAYASLKGQAIRPAAVFKP